FEEIDDQVGLGAFDGSLNTRQALAVGAGPGKRLAYRCKHRHTPCTLKRESGTGDRDQLPVKRMPEELGYCPGGIAADSYGHNFMALAFKDLCCSDGLSHVAPAIPLHGEHDLHTCWILA